MDQKKIEMGNEILKVLDKFGYKPKESKVKSLKFYFSKVIISGNEEMHLGEIDINYM